jgi:hypothetical protein
MWGAAPKELGGLCGAALLCSTLHSSPVPRKSQPFPRQFHLIFGGCAHVTICFASLHKELRARKGNIAPPNINSSTNEFETGVLTQEKIESKNQTFLTARKMWSIN